MRVVRYVCLLSLEPLSRNLMVVTVATRTHAVKLKTLATDVAGLEDIIIDYYSNQNK